MNTVELILLNQHGNNLKKELTWEWDGQNPCHQSPFEEGRLVDPLRENDVPSLAHWVPQERGTCIRPRSCSCLLVWLGDFWRTDSHHIPAVQFFYGFLVCGILPGCSSLFVFTFDFDPILETPANFGWIPATSATVW
jgi:hypothetical protein